MQRKLASERTWELETIPPFCCVCGSEKPIAHLRLKGILNIVVGNRVLCKKCVIDFINDRIKI